VNVATLSVVLSAVLSPSKSQDNVSTVPVDVLVKVTVSGSLPLAGSQVKPATGASGRDGLTVIIWLVLLEPPAFVTVSVAL